MNTYLITILIMMLLSIGVRAGQNFEPQEQSQSTIFISWCINVAVFIWGITVLINNYK